MTSVVAPSSNLATSKKHPAKLDLQYLRSFTEKLFGDFSHAKRLDSMANATVGVLHAASLAIHAIGASYASVTGARPSMASSKSTACSATARIPMKRSATWTSSSGDTPSQPSPP